MATVSVIGWRPDEIRWRGGAAQAPAEFSRRLKRAVSVSPAQRRLIEGVVLARGLVDIAGVSVDHVQSLVHVLEALGAELAIDMGPAGQWHRQRP
jgi:hypothetical protein